MLKRIPYNKPFFCGNELGYIEQAVNSEQISGDGEFTKKCSEYLESVLNVPKVLLTTSCTHALEMAAMLLNIQPGDEVIVPSFTFVSTVNAFVLRGAKPVFIDIRDDTLNMDETKLKELITPKTKAIIPVHYAGVACAMDVIMQVAIENNIPVVEDNAHGLFGKFKGEYLSTFGSLSTLSFHETKNFICGEGGALIINDERYIQRAEIIREKGTNRTGFFRGESEKYTWLDIGSSYLPSDILSAFLYAQLEKKDEILARSKHINLKYIEGLSQLENAGHLKLPVIPKECQSTHSFFYMLLNDESTRNKLINWLNKSNIQSVFHYLPLHLSPMGRSFGYNEDDLPSTEDISKRLIRLPFFFELDDDSQDYIIENIYKFFK